MNLQSKINELEWTKDVRCDGEDTLHTLTLYSSKLERITVLDRMTGYGGGIRDVESGYRDASDKFWLASGDCDVRRYDFTVQEAIEWIKKHANTCIGE